MRIFCFFCFFTAGLAEAARGSRSSLNTRPGSLIFISLGAIPLLIRAISTRWTYGLGLLFPIEKNVPCRNNDRPSSLVYTCKNTHERHCYLLLCCVPNLDRELINELISAFPFSPTWHYVLPHSRLYASSLYRPVVYIMVCALVYTTHVRQIQE